MDCFNQFIDNNLDRMIADLQGCVAIPSVYADDGSGYPYGLQNQRCLEYMLQLARSKGFSVHNMDGHVGWCEYGEGEELVIALGHLDVVPEGDGWTVPPYGGVVQDGRIYGRGTIDDKGPLMAAFYGLMALKDSGLPIQRRVRVLFGLDEERGSGDMRHYVENGGEIPVMGFTPDAYYPVINGEKGIVMESFTRSLNQTGAIHLVELEGGDAVNIVPAYAKARLVCDPSIAEGIAAMSAEKITCTLVSDGLLVEAAGVSAHGSMPEDGENAIGRLMLFLSRLPLEGDLAQTVGMLAGRIGMECFGQSLGIAVRDELSGPLTMNMGVIHGDREKIEVRLNYRYPVTSSFEQCGPAIRAAFEGVGFYQSDILHCEQLYMPEDSQLVEKLMKVYRDYTGDITARPKCIGGGTYAKELPNILAFGPVFDGDEVREHQADEFIEINRLVDCAKICAAAMYEMAK